MTTPKQQERQRFRDSGRYAKVKPCYVCGKSAGVDYCSHPMTDQTDTNGQGWGDRALRLCMKCLRVTEHMTTVEEFEVFLKARQS